jgi:thiosulfate/3-mercaptopyruvate sulfurtransferase
LRQPAVKWAFTTAVKLWLYDKGIYSAQGRGGFIMGHEKVWVLDGGLPAWIKEDYATEKDRNNYMKRLILLQISTAAV